MEIIDEGPDVVWLSVPFARNQESKELGAMAHMTGMFFTRYDKRASLRIQTDVK